MPTLLWGGIAFENQDPTRYKKLSGECWDSLRSVRHEDDIGIQGFE